VTGHPPLSRVAILGAGGQLGRALTAALAERGIPLTRASLDLADLKTAARTLDDLRPTALINAAAYNNVDAAESETELAFCINGEAPGFLARWSCDHEIPFIHVSTDYVFPGTGIQPWTEEDPVAPINAYGRSKVEGEQQVAAAGGRWLIFRTSWMYDESGRNFLTAMLRLGRERETLSVVDDQWGAPTYAPHLAAATLAALDRAMQCPQFPSGIYHACNGGVTTWCRFAAAIFSQAAQLGIPLALRSLSPITTAAYPSPAPRPLNSRLSTEKLLGTFGLALPAWQDGLSACMQNLGN
jgi:dTDP-4-dehydrorhamnose reductase